MKTLTNKLKYFCFVFACIFVFSGFTTLEEKDWIEAGFTASEAKKWDKAGIILDAAKEWRDAGCSLSEAMAWEETGLTRSTAIEWIKAGFTPSGTKEWRASGFFTPTEAQKWKASNFTPTEAKKFEKKGLDSAEAKRLKKTDLGEKWKTTGFDLLEAYEWKEAGFNPAEAKKWKDVGFDPAEAAEAKKSKKGGLDIYKAKAEKLKKVKRWEKAGFNYASALAWEEYGFDPEEAKKWKAAGFNRSEAKEWKDVGFNLQEAKNSKKVGFKVSEKKQIELSLRNQIADLLAQTGYTKTSQIQIHFTTITLANIFGTPSQEAYFYIFSTRDKKPLIKKIKVVVQTYRDDLGINFLSFAPILIYMECINKANRGNDCGWTQYFPEEFHNRKITDGNPFITGLGVPPPAVGGQRVGAYIFNYPSSESVTYTGWYGDTYAFCSFEDIYSLILGQLNENGRVAKFCIGSRYNAALGLISTEDNKTFCIDSFRKIYP